MTDRDIETVINDFSRLLAEKINGSADFPATDASRHTAAAAISTIYEARFSLPVQIEVDGSGNLHSVPIAFSDLNPAPAREEFIECASVDLVREFNARTAVTQSQKVRFNEFVQQALQQAGIACDEIQSGAAIST